MVELVLTDDQARLVADSGKAIKVVDSRGIILGILSPSWTEDDLREADRRVATTKKWHTSEEVLARLTSLEKQ